MTNLQIGAAGDGVQIDFDKTALLSMAVDGTATIDFDVIASTIVTAKLKQQDGSFNSEVTLNSSGLADLGNNIKFIFDASNIGTTIDQGSIAFDVEEIIPPDSYFAVLKKSMDNGITYTESIEDKSFALGDALNFDISGVSFQSTLATGTADEATFELVDGDLIDKSATMQIGANAGQTVSLEINNMQASTIGLSSTVYGGKQTIFSANGEPITVWYTIKEQSNNGTVDELTEHTLDASSNEKASAAISVLDDAIQRVSAERSRMGAIQNRLNMRLII